MKSSKFQFVDNPVFVSEADDGEIEMQNSFNIQVKRSKDENRANVELTLETNTENERAPFKLQIKVASDFKWEDLDEKTVDSMLNLNAPALLLSYMRPIVANITNSSKFPTYNLPFINFKE